MVMIYSCKGNSFEVAYSKDSQNPKRDVPYAIIISTVMIFVLYNSVEVVAIGVLLIK